jgi:hypothetical protein
VRRIDTMNTPVRPAQIRCAARVAVMTFALAGTACAAQAKVGFTVAADPGDDPVGALIGELNFQADLMSALDRLCPRGRPATDWHGALSPRVRNAYTPDLRELSRKLGAVAGAQVVREQGGCASNGFAAAYEESLVEYRQMQQRWREIGR